MKNLKSNVKGRVIALLTREEMEFLDKLSMDSLFSTRHKLSRVDAIAALVDAAIELGISADNVKSKKQFIEKILNTINNQEDKRRFPRIKKYLHVGFRKMDSMEKHNHSVTNNIGMGGFCMDISYLDKPPQVHQVIEITVKDPNEKEMPVKAIGRIAWICEKEGEHSLEVGVMLTYIKDEDKKRFEKYLSNETNLKE